MVNQGEKKVLIIAGNQRSGTSLLARLFDGHPDILSFENETNYFTQFKARENLEAEQQFFYLFGRPFDFDAEKKQPIGTKIEDNKNWQIYEVWQKIKAANLARETKEDILEALKKENTQKVFFLMADYYKKAIWPNRNEPKYILEKTPGNEHFINTIFKNFPETKIIHIVRDPFDVIESILRGKTEKERKNRIMGYINEWKTSTRLGVKYARKFPDNYVIVKFEDLVENTSKVMRRLSDFLNLDFREELLTPTTESGQKDWQSHTHQNITVAPGVIEKKLLQKNSAEVLGEDFMNLIGIFTKLEYKFFGWQKYEKYTKKPTWQFMFASYPNCNIKQTIKNTLNFLRNLLTFK